MDELLDNSIGLCLEGSNRCYVFGARYFLRKGNSQELQHLSQAGGEYFGQEPGAVE